MSESEEKLQKLHFEPWRCKKASMGLKNLKYFHFLERKKTLKDTPSHAQLGCPKKLILLKFRLSEKTLAKLALNLLLILNYKVIYFSKTKIDFSLYFHKYCII